MQNLKMTVVGDGGVGKSCLLISYNTGSFPGEYIPTVFDNYAANVMYDGKPYSLAFFDTAGQEDYDRLRPLSYPGTDIFLLCYSIENSSSLENCFEKWIPEITHFCPSAPVLLVACKTDLRSSRLSDKGLVSTAEIEAQAKKRGLQYAETSALAGDGLQYCFDKAIQMAVTGAATRKSKGFFGKKISSLPLPPVMPPAGKAPWIEIETSTFAEQWQSSLECPQHTDCVFQFLEGHRLQAHKLILSASSTYFREMFGITLKSQMNQLWEIESDTGASKDCFLNVHEELSEDNERSQTVLELSGEVKAKHFVKLLEFLYTGIPKFKDDVSEEELDNVINLSRMFNLPQLETICVNSKNEEDFLNPSIGTFLNDETGQKMKQMFLNSPLLSDITFNVEGKKIFAHKAVLSARCEVLAAMFSGNFSESQQTTEITIPDLTVETFLALLEYMYTDHAPIEEGDSVALMVAANQFCLTRLVCLCELYITKEVDKSCRENIEKSEIDVIGLLLTSQIHVAPQLSNWCLHFISTNYIAFESRPEFPALVADNRKHVEENRWPPVSYLEEIEEYEKVMKKREGRCSIM